MTTKIPALNADGGSFKDPSGRVYRFQDSAGGRRVVRGLTSETASTVKRLLAEPFFAQLAADGDVVETAFLSPDDPATLAIAENGWAAAVEHQAVDFVTWPYEWPFSMLKDAALLQLRLLDVGIRNGWTLKDAPPFNIQWTGTRPVFIDVPSFVPRENEGYWRGYRQFCSTFLTPLMLTAHLGVPFQPLLRSSLEGIPPEVADKFFYGMRRFKRGVPSHVWFPARVERRLRSRDAAPRATGSQRKQSNTTLLALLDDLARLVARLSPRAAESYNWAEYSETHSYGESEYERKKRFVERHVSERKPRLLWDLGANTGEFSRIAARHSELVVAVDSDHDAVEDLYRQARAGGDANVIPLVMDLANLSPSQGWAGRERASFVERGSPDVALCLALVHHMRVSANVPVAMFLDWLRSLDAAAIVEFVGRDDEMFAMLIENKNEDYADYTLENFLAEVVKRFRIEDSMELKGGKRKMLLLEPSD